MSSKIQRLGRTNVIEWLLPMIKNEKLVLNGITSSKTRVFHHLGADSSDEETAIELRTESEDHYISLGVLAKSHLWGDSIKNGKMTLYPEKGLPLETLLRLKDKERRFELLLGDIENETPVSLERVEEYAKNLIKANVNEDDYLYMILFDMDIEIKSSWDYDDLEYYKDEDIDTELAKRAFTFEESKSIIRHLGEDVREI